MKTSNIRTHSLTQASPDSPDTLRERCISILQQYALAIGSTEYLHKPREQRFAVDQLEALITEQVRLGSSRNGRGQAPTTPRELLCQICSREYCGWFAPNDLWNKVMRHPDGREASEKYSFVCASCFMKQAEALGLNMWYEVSEADRG